MALDTCFIDDASHYSVVNLQLGKLNESKVQMMWNKNASARISS